MKIKEIYNKLVGESDTVVSVSDPASGKPQHKLEDEESESGKILKER
jgi:hypothetical protein